MSWQDKESYLKEVLSQVKFSFDHEFIDIELRGHLEERVEEYISERYAPKEAEIMALENFGDPKEIGKALNKEHNPIVGWLLYVSNGLLLVACLYLLINILIPMGMSVFGGDASKSILKEDILYTIEVGEKVKIDDRVIHIKELIYEKSGRMNIIYTDMDTKLFGRGWSFGQLGTITDEHGRQYFDGSSFASNGVISKGRRSLDDFPMDAEMLIIEYDNYNRYYKVEIPLKVGARDE